jgi:serine/threonine-protein kinase
LGRLLAEVGAEEEGRRRLENALSLDPDSTLPMGDLVRLHVLMGRWDEAEPLFERLRGLDAFIYWTLRGRLVLWPRDSALAEAHLSQVPEEPEMRYPLALRHIARTRTMPPDAPELERAERTGGIRRQTLFFQLSAELTAYTGRHEDAVAAVTSAVELGLIDRLWLERCPLLDGVRADRRYPALHEDVRRRTDAILEAYRSG